MKNNVPFSHRVRSGRLWVTCSLMLGLGVFISPPVGAQQVQMRRAQVNTAYKANYVSSAKVEGNRLVVPAQAAPVQFDAALSANFNRFDVYQLDASSIQTFVHQKGRLSEVSLQLAPGKIFNLHLEEHDIRNVNYELRVQTENGVVVYPRSRNITYWGSVNDNPNDKLRLNIYNGQISGLIQNNGEDFYIEPVNRFDKESRFRPVCCIPRAGYESRSQRTLRRN
ncbi:MAG: hypothetical protein KDD54_04470 [Flavobacteriales bacterium]|nr:hypothetical protein [Flavobacteriales bacterium]